MVISSGFYVVLNDVETRDGELRKLTEKRLIYI